MERDELKGIPPEFPQNIKSVILRSSKILINIKIHNGQTVIFYQGYQQGSLCGV